MCVCVFVCLGFVFYMQLKQLGHSVDKVEFIVMGGTFMCLSEDYRDYFIRSLHDALSGHTSNNVAEAVRYTFFHLYLTRVFPFSVPLYLRNKFCTFTQLHL